ncbi:hypothetical protein BX600DRAFT_42247 [Xylariales sp. PMI_506]|nr:hypothetical protein BX600DRAFT_42247 [Xylariales sp. PMI_506]
MIWLNPKSSFLLLALSVTGLHFPGVGASVATRDECIVFSVGVIPCEPHVPVSFLPAEWVSAAGKKKLRVGFDLNALAEVMDSVGVLQTEYFAPWVGTWPESIDWTGAVMGTHVSGALRTLSEALLLMDSNPSNVEGWKLKENMVDDYFTQIVSYYFGENAFDIRNEAYDDILWVVLGWLEAVQFIDTHTKLYYTLETQNLALQAGGTERIATILRNQTWHGNLWVPAFSHRARVFWDLATKGWDTKLCGGGMNWNPRLLPYKNAITNELYIAASISMYLYFPGDDNGSPFAATADRFNPVDPDSTTHFGAQDPRYLKAAVDGYKWLVSSNMTNAKGLFTDGFHISGFANPASNNTKCDERNDMVFTYNQGVLLTGQRGLWEATGAPSYLSDGHQLIQNVINATGYDLERDKPVEDLTTLGSSKIPTWYGMGRLGVMEDICDASATCSQNSQTFKGIFFHHLTAFCAPIAPPPPSPHGSVRQVNTEAFAVVRDAHEAACGAYGSWLELNADAAMATRDADGRFGGWWTAGLLTGNFTGAWPTTEDNDGINHKALGFDYRTYGVPNDTLWRDPALVVTDPAEKLPINAPPVVDGGDADGRQKPMSGPTKHAPMGELRKRQFAGAGPAKDPNTRGRGRTVETQGSGLALMRAYWNLVQAP